MELAATYDLSISEKMSLNLRILPYTPAVVILNTGAGRAFAKMDYSLVPSWSKKAKVKFASHNARLETITEKPAWKVPFQTKRVLVPLTEFVESIYENIFAGNMVLFSKQEDALLTAAGIWDEWTDPISKKAKQSFAIITEEPPAYIAEMGHDRCPIFLNKESFDEWLNPNLKNTETLLQILKSKKEVLHFKTVIDRPLKAGWEKRK